MTVQQVQSFLKSHFQGRLRPGWGVEIRMIRPDPRDVKGLVTVDLARAADFAVEWNDRGYNAYFGVQPRQLGTTYGTKEDIPAAICLWQDLDKSKLGDQYEAALRALGTIPTPPSRVIDTGGGVHAYWYFTKPQITGDPEDRRYIEELNLRLLTAVNGDRAVRDLSRIFRLPGTINHKYDPPRAVIQIQVNGRTYEHGDFQWTPEVPKPPPPKQRDPDWSRRFGQDETAQEVVGLLQHIPPDQPHLSYEEWLECLMAIHWALPTDQGLEIAEAWAHGAQGEVAQKWRGFTEGGNVTIGTLYHYARKFGWKPDNPGLGDDPDEGTVPGDQGKAAGAPDDGGLGLTTLADLLSRPERPREWVVDNLFLMHGLSLLSAKTKAGKSTLAHQAAYCVANGEPFLQRAVQEGPVIYLAIEDFDEEVSRHFRGMGPVPTHPIHLRTGSFKAMKPDEIIKRLRVDIYRHRPSLVVIDPVAKLLRVKEMNEYGEMSAAFEPLIDLARECRVHLLCIHHNNKGSVSDDPFDAVLGSTAILGAVDAIFIIKRDPLTDQRSFRTRMRYGQDWDETVLVMDEATGRIDVAGRKIDVQQQTLSDRIIDIMKEGETLRKEEIRNRVGQNSGLVWTTVDLLVRQGRLKQVGEGGRGHPKTYEYVPWYPPSGNGTQEPAPKQASLLDDE